MQASEMIHVHSPKNQRWVKLLLLEKGFYVCRLYEAQGDTKCTTIQAFLEISARKWRQFDPGDLVTSFPV